MSRYSKEDIIRMVHEQDVEFIRMQFTDIFGQLKNVAITASQIEKAVDNQIMIDGSSIEGFVRIEESDQYLYPDLDSFAILPWRPQHGRVARLICDVYNPDGTPFVGDPRGVLKRVLKKARRTWAITFNVGPGAGVLPLPDRRGGQAHHPAPATRPATSTWAPSTTARAPAARSAWRWRQMGFEIEASPPRGGRGPARDRLQVRRRADQPPTTS